ncbi:MAG: 4-(cytidine 5'-diphospho)-2-C-methyl-D-erythritol kinase [Pseudomonadales bacterium]
MDELTLPAPAKINLGLNILGRRTDGYHNIETVFQLLDFSDQLSLIGATRDLSLECLTATGIAIPQENIPQEGNLVFQAAMALKRVTGYPGGARIRLDKRIPQGAGLGGGSSDAATTLLGLNRLWSQGLGLDELAELGRGLGADVPVFVCGHSAFAGGTGEVLTPMDLPPAWYVVVHPGVSVETAAIFGHPDLTRNGTAITIARFLEQGSFNACEALVRRLYPAVDEAVRWLSQWGPARMTGTGASVFLDLASELLADEVLAAVPPQWTAFKAEGMNKSPLHTELGI